MQVKRTITLLALGLSLALCGFGAVAWLASRAGVAEGQGLAGSAIILGYGLLGAIGGLSLVPLLRRSLQGQALNRLLVICGLPATVLLGTLIAAWLMSREATQAHLEQAYANLPPFRLTLERGPADGDAGFERFEADWGAASYRVLYEGRHCQGRLTGPDAVALLTALREAEGVLYKDAAPCGGSAGEAVLQMTFLIAEKLPPETRHEVTITGACLKQYPALGSPYNASTAFITRCL